MVPVIGQLEDVHIIKQDDTIFAQKKMQSANQNNTSLDLHLYEKIENKQTYKPIAICLMKHGYKLVPENSFLLEQFVSVLMNF